jgi:hypothetical protein
MRGRLRVDNTVAHLEQLTLHLTGSTRGSGGGGAKKQVSVPMCRGSQKEPDCCHSPCSNSEQIKFRVSRPSSAGCGSGGRACPGQPRRFPSAAGFFAAAAAGCGSGGRACPGQPLRRPSAAAFAAAAAAGCGSGGRACPGQPLRRPAAAAFAAAAAAGCGSGGRACPGGGWRLTSRWRWKGRRLAGGRGGGGGD